MRIQPTHERTGASTDTTRKIDTLRRIAHRASTGKEIDVARLTYLSKIADEFERIYLIMIERYEPGWRGMPLGIEDRNGVPIHVGDTLEFDKEEFGCECIFEMGWDKENCEPIHPGARGDLSQWCGVLEDYNGYSPILPREEN